MTVGGWGPHIMARFGISAGIIIIIKIVEFGTMSADHYLNLIAEPTEVAVTVYELPAVRLHKTAVGEIPRKTNAGAEPRTEMNWKKKNDDHHDVQHLLYISCSRVQRMYYKWITY